MLKIINAAEVRELLPMNECVDLMAGAMRAASAGEVHVPPRTFMPLVDGSGAFGLMPGSAADPKVYGAKIISLHEDNPAAGRPMIQGFVTLFDHNTGTPVAIIEGAEITAIRTAAASGLATRILAREDARTHGIFGTGVQAITHIEAIAVARPITETLVWGRDPKKAGALAAEQSQKTGMKIRATSDPTEAATCDVVSTVTGASEPVLLGSWIKPGTHINLVGAHTPDTRESDSDLIAAASIFTDFLESLFNESGDILTPLEEGRIDRESIRGEIGRIVSGQLDGRSSAEEITVYVSLGMTAQDLFAAHAVYEKALATGSGTDVEF